MELRAPRQHRETRVRRQEENAFALTILFFPSSGANRPESAKWLAGHLANQFAYLPRHHGSSGSSAADLPGPEQAESLAVPGNHGSRFHDAAERSPIGPCGTKPSPQQAVAPVQPGILHRTLQHAQLMAKGENLKLQCGPDRNRDSAEASKADNTAAEGIDGQCATHTVSARSDFREAQWGSMTVVDSHRRHGHHRHGDDGRGAPAVLAAVAAVVAVVAADPC